MQSRAVDISKKPTAETINENEPATIKNIKTEPVERVNTSQCC
jgi:hypothetical protein